jgi:rod shape determining protein RodA
MINKLLQVFFRHIDAFLMGCLLFTMLVGLFVLYSASGQNIDRVTAQLINISVALFILWVVSNIQPQLLERIAVPAYMLGMAQGAGSIWASLKFNLQKLCVLPCQ